MKILDRIMKALQPVPSGSGSWFPLVRENSPGAWQRGETVEVDTAVSHSAVYACVSLISNDIAKLPIAIAENKGNYWAPVSHPLDRLLRKPNAYQNRIQFIAAWIASKLLHGNTYALKQRDQLGRIVALHILDPLAVTPLIAEDSSVFYRCRPSKLANGAEITVPAREIIHDRFNCWQHPLVGLSPLTAAGLAAAQALDIQQNSRKFFANGSRPGGVLTAPGNVPAEVAERLKAHWDANYTGANSGKVAVLGDGLKFESMAINAADSQLIEQLSFSALDVCRAFNMPAFKVSAGAPAPYTSSEATNLAYLADCLHSHIESLELCLDDGLDLPANLRTELDESSLLRLDTQTRANVLATELKAGLLTINEGRAIQGRPPVEGGDQIMRQMQDVPLAQGGTAQ